MAPTSPSSTGYDPEGVGLISETSIDVNLKQRRVIKKKVPMFGNFNVRLRRVLGGDAAWSRIMCSNAIAMTSRIKSPLSIHTCPTVTASILNFSPSTTSPLSSPSQKRRNLLKNSNNLRFKGLYKPIEPAVLISFLFVAGSILLFLRYVVHAKP
jgi:hypothetical protein